MAFISVENTKKIKQKLKETFPTFKFSVRNENLSGVKVEIIKANVDNTTNNSYININNYKREWKDNTEAISLIDKIIDIMNSVSRWYDKSDVMSDYFDKAYYRDIQFSNNYKQV